MEIKGAENRKGLVMLCEILGTALYIYGIIMTGTAASIPISLFTSMIIFGAITGGHFNPAVSIGVYLAEGKESYKKNLPFLLMIWAA